jgi:hypothetical protein
MIIWEDNNNGVSDLRTTGNSQLRATVRGGKRGAGAGVNREHTAVLKSPIAMAFEVLGRLLAGIIAICALVLAICYVLPMANEGDGDYRDPQRAEAFGWEVAYVRTN